ncbi:hypothetical protein [Spirillospora sp. NBC_01491]|uniref:hypothetical protein n=1 Tax=Spirillospora sp. NBC_01491 TaxID=2976007 RepID=UPI002E30D0A7|nr:hypothetical protein [Spirillospora sp. NBC_01491]
MTVSRAVARTLAGGLTALSLTACLGVREPETAAPPASPPGTAAPETTPPAQAAPSGWKTVGGPDNGVRISIPEGWVDIAISNGEAASGLDRLGLKGADREVMMRSISQLQERKGVFAVLAASTETPFATNVNALCTPSGGATLEQVKAATRTGLQQIGARNVQATTATIGGRPGVRATYEMASALGTLSGHQGQVPDGDRTCTVTVTAKQGAMPASTGDILNTMELL